MASRGARVKAAAVRKIIEGGGNARPVPNEKGQWVFEKAVGMRTSPQKGRKGKRDVLIGSKAHRARRERG